jgi:hypothetical protein
LAAKKPKGKLHLLKPVPLSGSKQLEITLQVRPAVEGEEFDWRNWPRQKVEPKGEGDEGEWTCIGCGEGFPHNMAKDAHCQGPRKPGCDNQPGGKEAPGKRAHHVLAWWSGKGFEVP